MFRRRVQAVTGMQIMVLFLMAIVLPLSIAVAAEDDEALWYTLEDGDQAVVKLYFFWSVRCPHCRRAQR